jgi:hypothetical protein
MNRQINKVQRKPVLALIISWCKATARSILFNRGDALHTTDQAKPTVTRATRESPNEAAQEKVDPTRDASLI